MSDHQKKGSMNDIMNKVREAVGRMVDARNEERQRGLIPARVAPRADDMKRQANFARRAPLR